MGDSTTLVQRHQKTRDISAQRHVGYVVKVTYNIEINTTLKTAELL